MLEEEGGCLPPERGGLSSLPPCSGLFNHQITGPSSGNRGEKKAPASLARVPAKPYTPGWAWGEEGRDSGFQGLSSQLKKGGTGGAEGSETSRIPISRRTLATPKPTLLPTLQPQHLRLAPTHVVLKGHVLPGHTHVGLGDAGLDDHLPQELGVQLPAAEMRREA